MSDCFPNQVEPDCILRGAMQEVREAAGFTTGGEDQYFGELVLKRRQRRVRLVPDAQVWAALEQDELRPHLIPQEAYLRLGQVLNEQMLRKVRPLARRLA